MSNLSTDQNMRQNSREAALTAARAADSKKATDIMVQDVSELIGVTDYFIIVTATNSLQVNAIVDEVCEKLRENCHLKPTHIEKSQDGSWSLIDCGNIIIHVFQPETREYYRLESLWNEAPIIDLTKEEGFSELQYSDRIMKLIEQSAKA
jgi:ribosome-associated protein